jgi:hypothetical protein
MSTTNQELFNERLARIQSTIDLRIPDRVPIWFQDAGYFPAKYVGITCQEAMFESEKLFTAYKQTLLDFAPDAYFGPGQCIRIPGGAFELLDAKTIRLPGRQVSPYHTHQAVEGEYMLADEYDQLLDDPLEFAFRKLLPRIYGVCRSFENIPQLHGFLDGYNSTGLFSFFTEPEIVTAFEAFYKAGLIVSRHREASTIFDMDMAKLGFPQLFSVGARAPFDVISDFLRGMRGTSLDMYRQPEKLLAVIEKLTPRIISTAITAARENGSWGVFIALHRGADGFMSGKQFETFYWPSLKKLIMALINDGLLPCVFFEGNCGSRLEYLTELPKGKVLGMFDNTDPIRLKEIIGDIMCISGLMPLSLLQFGPPEKIREYSKKLIDTVGKDGGFIMGPKSIMDEADPELVKVWLDFTREYGHYN